MFCCLPLIVLSLGVFTTVAAALSQVPILTASHGSLLTPRFRSWTALGDSYAAGLGCGYPIGPTCARFNLSYPEQLQSSSAFGVPPPDLNLRACSGAFMPGVLHDQAPLLGPGAEFATLTVSGNDVGFPNLMSACIYRFFGWRSGVCEDEISRTQGLVDEEDLKRQIWDIVRNVTTKGLSQVPTFQLFMTGYAAFFNEDTAQCDHVSFQRCVAPAPLCWFDVSITLTRNLRRRLNRLVTDLNVRLLDIVEEFNQEAGRTLVTFVDYNKDFDGHRFCEVGVIEPDNDPTRSWFYNIDTHDEVSQVEDRQKLERALHPTASGHQMIAKKILSAINQHFGVM